MEGKDNYQINEEESHIEDTDDSSDEHNREPFDPTKIDIKTKSLNVDLLVKRLRSDPARIDLNTAFQRGNDLWRPDKQSRLIESMMIRLPLPVFYFDASNDNNWEVVDGLQRLTTLYNFIVKKNLRLTGLEYLSEYDGKLFDELPEYMKTRIEETEITAYLVSPGTPTNVKYNIFKRINTSGLVLEPQEIRHAVNQGIPANFIKELAELPYFIEATGGAIKPRRMADRDFVTRFISFYLTPYNEYRPDLDTFLTNGMAKLNKIKEEDLNYTRLAFINSMRTARAIFGNDAFRKRYSEESARSPVNKALFEVWAVNLAQLNHADTEKLIQLSRVVKDHFIALMNNKDFDTAISRATGDIRAVRIRFEAVKNLIDEILYAY